MQKQGPEGRQDRISSRVSPITRRKLLRLADSEHYKTQSAALDIAIDRLYRDTFNTDELPEDTDKEGDEGNE